MNEKMRRQLETVEELHGYIAILKTNFTSLDFLKNLKRVNFIFFLKFLFFTNRFSGFH